MTNKKHKFAAAILSGLVVLSVFAAVGVTPASAATVEELTAQINSLLATIASLQSQISSVSSAPTKSSSSGSGYTFTRNLKQGDTGADVRQLQVTLNMDSATRVASSGAGSPGYETSSFGPATKAAVIRFQNKYASAVLTPFGLSSGTGFVGSGTRAKLNGMGGGSSTTSTNTTTGMGGGSSTTSTNTTTTTTTTTTGTTPAAVVAPKGSGLTVTAAAVQPGAQLAPINAARIPFTKVTFMASADGDVTVNSLVVERQGQSVDAALASVVLLDEQGTQVGLSKTLNSQHQANLSTAFVVKAGQSRTMTLAANRDAGASAYAGMVVALGLVQVNTSATVNGSFPISGTAQTINQGLTIGSATVARGSLDPSTSVTKEVGITGYTFSAIRVTAGSGEDLRLRSVRFNQTESANASDLANIMVYVDGTGYTPVITDSGQYYTASFGNGLLIPKGFSKEISIKGDVLGGSGRKVDFNIAKQTDINLSGELYGYGIMPAFGTSSTANDSQVHAADDYYYDGSVLTIDVGNINISTSNASPAQNIAINTANQPLGSFLADVKGEAISVGRLAFNVNLTGEGSGDDVDLLTNVTLVDENGSVVAGPVDGSATDSSYTSGSADGSLVFTDTVNFPIGQHTYKLLGKVGTAMDNNTVISASTTPNNDFATVRGLTTGKTITPGPASALTFALMTVKSGALAISVSSQPTARTIIAGGKGIEFARYTLDAGSSGEDLRVTTLPLYYDTSGTRTDVTNCQLHDGSATGVSLTTGSNTKNPATTDTASSTSFTFDGSGLIVPKGVTKTLSLTCDLKSGVTADYWWGVDNQQGGSSNSYTGVTGLVSAQTITETITTANGQRMTASAGGSYTVAADNSAAYSYRAVRANTSDVVLAAFKFTADLTEDLTLKRIAFQLGNVASNSPADLVDQKITVWWKGVRVGDATIDNASSPDYATSTLSSSVLIHKGDTEILVIKGSLINQDANTNTTSTAGSGGYGSFLAVTYDGNSNGASQGNYAVGTDSGANVSGGTLTDQTTSGVRVFRNVPTFTLLSTGGALTQGGDLYKFKVTNPDASRDLILKKVSFSIATTGSQVLGFILYGDGVAANASVDASDVETAGTTVDAVEIRFGATSSTTQAAVVPAGSSKTYILKATTVTVVTTAPATDTLGLSLLSDTGYPACQFLMCKVTTVDVVAANGSGTASTSNNIIWSPFSTTTPASTVATEANLDWTNGYGVPFIDASGVSLPPGQDMTLQTWSRSR